MSGPRSTFSLRTLLIGVSFVAGSIGWSANWSDCKHQAVLHAALASVEERAHKYQKAEWHQEMRRRYERAAWLPWPGSTSEPPQP
jgi:hypothetical protein